MENLIARQGELESKVTQLASAQKINVHWLTALVCTSVTVLAFLIMDRRSADRHVEEEIAIATVKGEIENPLTLSALRENLAISSRLDTFNQEVMTLKTELDQQRDLIDDLNLSAGRRSAEKSKPASKAAPTP